MSEPVAVGLVGAGPWAEIMHAPVLAAGPETRLAGVWARRYEQSSALAARHGVPAFAEYEELLAACEAVAFSVPPDVQAAMGVRAAEAGRALLLDKPIGITLDQAEELVAAVDRAGVVTQVVLSNRYRPEVRAFLAGVAAGPPPVAGRGCIITGAFLDGPFATPWRQRYGALHDLGPHAFDLIDAALGTITEVDAVGDPRAVVLVTCRHETGAVSQLALSGAVPMASGQSVLELYGPDGAKTLNLVDTDSAAGFATARAEFAAAVRTGTPHPLDVHRALHLQRLIDRALTAAGAAPAPA
ncbi:MAG: Gfo/Idh/MocA family protein [Mycobacteriales bacterium]|jgi:predicted dehydrogenase